METKNRTKEWSATWRDKSARLQGMGSDVQQRPATEDGEKGLGLSLPIGGLLSGYLR